MLFSYFRKTILPATVFFLFLCLLPALPARAQDNPPKFYWKVATVAPEGLGWSKHMKDIVFPVMDQITGGDLKLKVYWGGALGDEEGYIEKMKSGVLQGAGLSAQGTVLACPQMAVFELPFLFNNYVETDYVRVKMDRYLNGLFRKNGLFLIGWIDQDFDQIYSTKYPMDKLADFRNSRFLSWYGPMEEAMLKELGAQAVPIDVPEFAGALRSGKGDAVIAPAVAIVGTQTHSKFRYINLTKIRYSPATLVLTMDAIKQFPPHYLKAFYWHRLVLGWKYSNLSRKDNDKYVQALIEYGLKPARMPPKELTALKKLTRRVWDRDPGGLYTRELLDTVTGYLADFRAGKRLDMEDIASFVRIDGEKLNPEEMEKLKKLAEDGLKEFGMGGGKLLVIK